MEIPDLYEFPAGHPPSPYNHPVHVIKSGYGFLPEGLALRAVGWFDGRKFATGIFPDEFIGILVHALDRVFRDGYRGVHSCGVCGKTHVEMQWKGRMVPLHATGHYLLRHDRYVYVAPAFLLHYISAHNYRPPDEFLEAV